MPGPVLICAQTPEGHQEVRKAGSSRDEGGQGWGDFSLNTSGSIPKLISEGADHDELEAILWELNPRLS